MTPRRDENPGGVVSGDVGTAPAGVPDSPAGGSSAITVPLVSLDGGDLQVVGGVAEARAVYGPAGSAVTPVVSVDAVGDGEALRLALVVWPRRRRSVARLVAGVVWRVWAVVVWVCLLAAAVYAAVVVAPGLPVWPRRGMWLLAVYPAATAVERVVNVLRDRLADADELEPLV